MLEGKRVLQVSLDISVPEECDGSNLAEKIASEIDKYYDLSVVGFGFTADLTEIYRSSWL